MVKYLHFNPTNFNQLILSGLLIEIYKDDIECHPSEQTHELKFIQGLNVVENTIEGILKFANNDCRKKFFGLNAQQEAVINMVNGVCKDIDTKLASAESEDDLRQKVEYLNQFWASLSYKWLKHKFYYCHMNILTLSFRVQEKFPDILIKYPVFVELRRLFISDKWLSKRALVSMFANPCNVYQEFDLFPEAEGECSLRSSFGVPAESGEEDSSLQQIEQNFVEIQAVEIPDGSDLDGRRSYHQKQRVDQRFTESEIEQPHEQHNPVESHITQNEFRNIDSQISKINTENTSRFEDLQDEDRFQKLADESKIAGQSHEQNEATHSQVRRQKESQVYEVVGSTVPVEVSAVVGELVSEVRSDLDNIKAHQETKDQSRIKADQTMNESSFEVNQRKMDSSENDGSNKMKKSLKESFSEHFTRPLEYSTKSLTDKDEKVEKTQVAQRHQQNTEEKQKEHQENHYHETHEEVKKVHEQETKEEKLSVKHEEKQHKAEQPTAVQLKKQLIIDQAQSQKYVSQQQVDHHEPKPYTQTHKVEAQQKPQTQESPQQQVNPQQSRQVNKAPESESLASQKGPKTEMQQSIKPKEQQVQRSKESCKCEIY